MKKFFYRVTEDDSILSISNEFLVPFSVLVKLNNLKREVSVGDLLYIEVVNDRRLYTVQPFDTPSSVAKRFNVSEQSLLSDNCVEYLFYGLKIYV